jgi:hypothetical protein
MNQTELIATALAGLVPLGLKATVQKQVLHTARAEGDAFARIARGKVKQDVVIEARRAVTPAMLGAILVQTRAQTVAHGKPVILVTDHVTPPVAERLRANGQQFIDVAGNAYLEAPAWLVHVVGRKAARTGVPKHAANGATPAGLKVAFALLCDPALADAPQRTIALAAGVALGAVPGILADMRDTGHLIVVGKARRHHANKRMLDDWAMMYARTLRPKTLTATYTTEQFRDWEKWKLDPNLVKWGAEPAAALFTRYLRPGILTFYAEKMPGKLIAEFRLKPVREPVDGPVLELRKPFWGKTIAPGPREDTVPPVLVYADLLATGDARCIETAQRLYDDFLVQFFPAA